jgi:enamine deaminase RidA (YjgF/YER057c/UK114 family)
MKGISKIQREMCQVLLEADHDIRDIIQFGSSVYACHSALDIDLLITTKKKKNHRVYINAVSDSDYPVDVIVRQPGERIGDRVAWGICATGILLYGSGETFLEAKEAMWSMPPTFERARLIFERADDAISDAQTATRDELKDECYGDAFNKLFNVARTAVMAYLSTDEARWGELRRRLPRRFSERFRRIIDTLHIQYAYNGEYPKARVESEYHRWRTNVAKLVDNMEQAIPQ